MKRRRSIPVSAVEKIVREYSRTPGKKSWGEWPREVECRVNGKLVGTRWYDEKDRLIAERPSRNGKLHGMLLEWDDDGYLEHVAPYVNGRMEGTAKQYRRGRLVGTYTIKNGTGLDVWRNWREDGSWFVSEIWPLRHGNPDGIECWFNEDERSVWREAHWRSGKLHGIERE